MNFGIATADITPPIGVRLWGYEPRVATFIDHPLRAEALACDNGTGGWILLCADLGAFSAPLSNQIRSDIAEGTGLRSESVMLTATHTHSGPHVTDALWNEQSEKESAYFRELREKLVDVAQRAWRARCPGILLHTQTVAPDLGSNRRIQTDAGTWLNRWRDPEGINPGYFDPGVDLLGIKRPNGRLEALLVNYGCHPVGFGSLSPAISGDYVSYLKDALEKSGLVHTVLFTVSGHANIDPRDGCQENPEVVRLMGSRLADTVSDALPALARAPGTVVAAANRPWEFQTTWELDGRMAIYFPFAKRLSRVRTVISALRMGDTVIIGLPGETVSEYRAIFRQRSPFKHTLTVSLANDFIGYLTTDEILSQGAYEADICPVNPIQQSLTAHVDGVLQMVSAVDNPKKPG